MPHTPAAPTLAPGWFKLLWLALPVAGLAFHFAVGRQLQSADEAQSALARGNAELSRARWESAAEAFSNASKLAPPDRNDLQAAATIGRAKAQIQTGDLSEAAESLHLLLDARQSAQEVPLAPLSPALLAEARAAAAEAHYYAAYALKLENAPREMWNAELETARQNFRHLAQGDPASTPSTAQTPFLFNLEQAHRLEHVSAYELAARPVPEPCQGACKKGLFKKKCDQMGRKPSEDSDPKPKGGSREKYKLESGS